MPECVLTFVGGNKREVFASLRSGQSVPPIPRRHPLSIHVGRDRPAVMRFYSMQYDGESEIFASRHADLLQIAPVFTGDRSTDLAAYLRLHLANGGGYADPRDRAPRQVLPAQATPRSHRQDDQGRTDVCAARRAEGGLQRGAGEGRRATSGRGEEKWCSSSRADQAPESQ